MIEYTPVIGHRIAGVFNFPKNITFAPQFLIAKLGRAAISIVFYIIHHEKEIAVYHSLHQSAHSHGGCRHRPGAGRYQRPFRRMQSAAYPAYRQPPGSVYHPDEPGISLAMPTDENPYPGTDGTGRICALRSRSLLRERHLAVVVLPSPDGRERRDDYAALDRALGILFPAGGAGGTDGSVGRHEPDGRRSRYLPGRDAGRNQLELCVPSEMLARLGLEYLDLVYLHQPLGDYNGAWKELEKALEMGKVRAIGISDFDFNDELFESIVVPAKVKPQMFQIECHPYAQREHWQEMAAKYNIQIESWFPLGGRDSHGEILRDPVINAIAKAHGKSAAQVIIRWHLQKGFCVVPGSSNPAHIQENIESFSFTLSDDEMKQIAALNKEKRYFNMSYEQIKAWMGDYELWD